MRQDNTTVERWLCTMLVVEAMRLAAVNGTSYDSEARDLRDKANGAYPELPAWARRIVDERLRTPLVA